MMVRWPISALATHLIGWAIWIPSVIVGELTSNIVLLLGAAVPSVGLWVISLYIVER